MKKNTLLLLALALCCTAMAQTPKTPKFKVVTTQLSKGSLPGREYLQLIVDGKNTCSETTGGDSIADLRGIVIYDKNGDSVYINGTDTTPGIASSKYIFPNTPLWDSISYGSIILIYNDRNKNNSITIPDDSTGRINPHLYVIPARWLQLADSTTKPSKDSILPSPPELNLQEGQYAYLIYPDVFTDYDIPNLPANWADTTVVAGLEAPGSFNTEGVRRMADSLLIPATKPFNVSLNIFPPPVVFENGRLITNYFCPRVISVQANSSLPDSSVNYNWSLNNSILQNISDSINRILHQNDSVVLTTSTSLKCITGNVHSVTDVYYASNIYPLPPTLYVNIIADSSKPWIDTLGRDSLGNVDSTITYKTFNIGSITKLSAVPNYSGLTDDYLWVKNGVYVSYDSIYYDSSIANRDTIYCILSSSLYCVSKPYDTTTIILTAANPVPITLSSFTATAKNNTIQTNWQTAAELNTSHFIIQHSTDGSSFTEIGIVKAIGSRANSYSFTDTHPANGTNYYRLESVDKDGAVSFSKVVSASLTINDSRLTIYPNPAKDNVTISGNHIASVQVIDNMGRVVKVVSLKDATNPTMSVSSLPAGVYHLRIQTTDGGVSGVSFVKE